MIAEMLAPHETLDFDSYDGLKNSRGNRKTEVHVVSTNGYSLAALGLQTERGKRTRYAPETGKALTISAWRKLPLKVSAWSTRRCNH